MKVKELIELLQQFDGELPVFLRGYEGGWKDPIPPRAARVQLDANPDSYCGPHEELATPEDEQFAREFTKVWDDKDITVVDAVLLPRS